LALLAFVLMPIGMGPAAAAATHARVASMALHCGEHPAKPDGKTTHNMDCAAACSMTIAEAATIDAPIALPAIPATTGVRKDVEGLTPEADTPPPKHA
jgi:hypothetical protein